MPNELVEKGMRLFKNVPLPGREQSKEEVVDFNEMGGDIDLEDKPQGQLVRVSNGRGWVKGRVQSTDGENYKVKIKNRGGFGHKVITVAADRVLTEDEAKALKGASGSTRIRR